MLFKRRMLRIPWTTYLSNEDVLKKMESYNIPSEIVDISRTDNEEIGLGNFITHRRD